MSDLNKESKADFRIGIETFKKIINSSIDGFAITNLTGKIIEVNNSYCQVLGYTRDEILRLSLINIEAEMTKDELRGLTSTVVEIGGNRFETKNKKKDGSIIDVEVSVSYSPENNGTFLVFIRDISDRKKAEKKLLNLTATLDKKVKKRTIELKKLNEHLIHSEENQQKRFAAELHDNILQNLGWCVSLLKDRGESYGNKDDYLIDAQKHIENSTRQIRELIHDLHPQVLEDFSTDIAIGYLVEKFNADKRLHIEYSNKFEEPANLNKTLKITLYRAVSELITNILKHAGTTKAKVELTNNKKNIKMKVEDNGAGFVINSESYNQNSGFGLFSLSERVNNMGGKLKIDSSPGKGTRVELSVPVNLQ